MWSQALLNFLSQLGPGRCVVEQLTLLQSPYPESIKEKKKSETLTRTAVFQAVNGD